jgi:hypothetical protein
MYFRHHKALKRSEPAGLEPAPPMEGMIQAGSETGKAKLPALWANSA